MAASAHGRGRQGADGDAESAPVAGEEQQVVAFVGKGEVDGGIGFGRFQVKNAHAAAPLTAVKVARRPLGLPAGGEGDHV
jgi:hypothetical protein